MLVLGRESFVNKSMERQIQHFSHEHPLFLKAEKHKIDDADHSEIQMACCSSPNSGPIYSCEACGYFLHKVCAELPIEMNFHMHPKHTLTLLSKTTYRSGGFICNMCRQSGVKFVYNCSICSFDVHLACASVAHAIEEICHQHPLYPIQVPNSFYCHFCGIEKKGLSYKCNICPFWIHQNCTVLVTDAVNHSHHHHALTFLQSIPIEYNNVSKDCDICHERLPMFHCVYYCDACKFFAHVSCARSEITCSSVSRDQDLPSDGQRLALLPPQPNSTNLITGFMENNIDTDANIPDKIDHLDHEHPLLFIDEQLNKEMCRACAVPITTPSYGCRECNYFLHKCCTELPKQISHPSHPHGLSLSTVGYIFMCHWCSQWCNGFYYKCLDCETFKIDIKCCLSLTQRPLYHKAHRHPLIPRLVSLGTSCTACGYRYSTGCFLHCETCSFKLCIMCAMCPPTMKHRWDEHPFELTYSPPENHYNEYYCILCEHELNPKLWFYYCSLCDQFAHNCCMLRQSADSNIRYGVSYKFKAHTRWCMRRQSADSNIRYGGSYEVEAHEHLITLIDCTYNTTICDLCRHPLKRDLSIGFECKECDFNVHLVCPED